MTFGQDVTSDFNPGIHVGLHLACVLYGGIERSTTLKCRPRDRTGQGATLLGRPSASRHALHFWTDVYIQAGYAHAQEQVRGE